MANINGIPVYMAVLGEGCGMQRVSLVDLPAVMTDFESFADEPKLVKYAVQDEEKRIVRGVLMRADFPIYRYNKRDGEYYIMFSADTIREMAQQYLAEGRQNEVNLMHEDGSEVEGVEMVQLFIKDTANGVDPVGFEDCADGSLFAEYHVLNDEVWNAIKEGTYKGFSIEVSAFETPATDQEQINEIAKELEGKFKEQNKTIMSKIEKLKSKLADLLKMGSISTDKGVISYEGEELEVGMAVQMVNEEGEVYDVEDGEYITDDNIIVISGGAVTEIKDKEAEPEGEPEGEGEPEAEAEPTSEGMSACRMAFDRHIEMLSASFIEIFDNIYTALGEIGVDGYVVDAGDDYAIVETYVEGAVKFIKYAIGIDEEGKVTIDESSAIEVKYTYVPVAGEPGSTPEDSRVAELENENEALRAEISELKKMPAAQNAHEAFQAQQTDKFTEKMNKAVAIASALRR